MRKGYQNRVGEKLKNNLGEMDVSKEECLHLCKDRKVLPPRYQEG